MMQRVVTILVILSCLFLGTAFGQQSTIIGHRDLISYFNPALANGTTGRVSYVYRYQWQGFGPSSNTLFFEYPVQGEKKPLSIHSIGSVFQYEDFDFINAARLEVFASGTIAQFESIRLGLGLNTGLNYSGINTQNFNVEELIDPELASVSNELAVTNRFGLSVSHRKFQVGLATRLYDFSSITDYHGSVSYNFPLLASKFSLSPILITRMTHDFVTQMEAQLQANYDNKVSFTTGYRQEFGAIFQLAIRINSSAKVSYGLETPQNDLADFGLSHEVLGSYFFDTPALVKYEKDSLNQIRKDSIMRERVERYRKLEQEEIAKKAYLDSIASLKEATDTLSIKDIPEKNNEEQEEETEQEEANGIEEKTETDKQIEEAGDEDVTYTSLDDLTKNVEDHTHVILDHIGFEFGLYLLKPESFDEIDKVRDYLKSNKKINIEIGGHTDNHGTHEANIKLSTYRAKSVYNYLISRGISKDRMKVIGYGETQPLYPNDTEEHKGLNRRIEIVFIRK